MNGPVRDPAKDERGFSLIELLAVLVIMAIVVGISLPDLSSLFVSAKDNVAIRQVMTALRSAQEHAIISNASFKVELGIGSKNHEWRISPVDRPEPEDESSSSGGLDVIEIGLNVIEFEAGEGADGEAGKEDRRGDSDERSDLAAFAIVFMPDGTSSGGKIVLESDRGRRYVVNIDPVTGRVSVKKIAS